MLLNRLGLARERGLIDEKVRIVQHDTVRRDNAARGELYDISGYELGGGNLRERSIPQDAALHLNMRAQHSDGVARAVFLQKAQHRAAEHDCEDDQRIQPVPRCGGDAGRNQHNQDDRALKLAEKQ